MMQITNRHIKKFKRIKDAFLSKTSVPKINTWKKLSNDKIWLHFITQVIVVGGAAPAKKFEHQPTLKRSVSYSRLSILEDEDKVKKSINRVLRKVGTRYASKDVKKCKKTQALSHNLKILKGFRNGPKGLLKRVAEFTGRNENKRKVKYFMKVLQYIQSKGARDFLMELGLIRDAIALDIRVQNVLEKVGVNVPNTLANNPQIYDQVERELLNKICKPLRLSGVQFDRMIYQNYNEIMKMKL